MAEAKTYKCPSCGAYLVFDPETQDFSCPFCARHYTKEEAERGTEAAKPQSAGDAHLREYHCSACGAAIVTDDTTAATFCYYCHNPVVLTDRVGAELKPDAVIPFAIDRDEALRKFKEYLSKKKFVQHSFFSDDALEKLSGVYYPYWLGEISGEGEYQGKGTRSSVAVTPRENVTTTRHYDVRRRGHLVFPGMVRKALQKNDRQLSDGIWPYELGGEKAFSMAYLSGFLAEKRDVEKNDAAQDMAQEAQGEAEKLITRDLHYDTLRGSAQMTDVKARLRYLLLPTWVLTYRGDKPGTTFFYMMNGQTGSVCGKLPINWGKLLAVSGIAGAVVTGLMCLGGALLW